MPRDFSNVIFDGFVNIAAIIASAITGAYPAKMGTVTVSAWLMNVLEHDKIAPLLASSMLGGIELLLLIAY